VLTGMPAMTAEQVVVDMLINDLDDDFGWIRKTVGGQHQAPGRAGVSA